MTKPNFLIAPRSTGARDVDKKIYAGYDWPQTHYKLFVPIAPTSSVPFKIQPLSQCSPSPSPMYLTFLT